MCKKPDHKEGKKDDATANKNYAKDERGSVTADPCTIAARCSTSAILALFVSQFMCQGSRVGEGVRGRIACSTAGQSEEYESRIRSRRAHPGWKNKTMQGQDCKIAWWWLWWE